MAESFEWGDPVHTATLAQACSKDDDNLARAGLFTFNNFGCVMWEAK